MYKANCLFLVLTSLYAFSLMANPWGKDSDLIHSSMARKCPQKCLPSQSTFLTRYGMKAIRFHQEIISPADGPRSHYIPSSSQYTLDAMNKYGFLEGFILGCDRLMRENEDEWVYRKTRDPSGRSIKWNPVP